MKVKRHIIRELSFDMKQETLKEVSFFCQTVIILYIILKYIR